ncbi:DSBA oxidoreductase [Haliangium ochraceum DSM 14365]|uniref:DSBA oxidoreductase n=2 Tax=Haliangium ochraceum TaxID=80816 RepID=D0LRH6_HALO1|nr:DSBA oxidoreductase [Haliangium ochraceum DSM 14365]
MKRTGMMMLSMLTALAISACVPTESSPQVGEKLDEINGRLDKIEQTLRSNRAGAAAANRGRQPQRRPGPDPEKTYSVAVEGAPAVGPADAKVTVVKAFEFACPFCERARGTMDQIREEYGDDVRIVYKHYIVHPGSATVPAQASCAAGMQGKWKAMEDLIWDKAFKAGRDLSEGKMEELAKEAGLDMAKYKADMEGACKELVQKDHQQMAKVGVTGTPGFFINGRFLRGAQPFPAFKAVIDEEMKKADERIGKGTPKGKYYDEWVISKGEKSL